ncbi:MAG: 2,3,4,5-tetrahydropyridine-2,6-dicarboxylate N-succinyltransferase [Bacteroidetes bacterium]|jgi:2,3,4,5-tetrahydropyridine-2-carboxylate N-succinyltransferase|nr:2,3,4,5-tetrahydropyridine-2,6-dicarboxylate N-succinyltransferase [Bacteroidota bacterium]
MNWEDVLDKLETGELRAAEPHEDHWVANVEVKEAILEAFKNGENVNYGGIYDGFVDKNNLPPRKFDASDRVRLVPGGSSVRRGAYIAEGVIIMPPAYVNIGGYVDSGSMIDSHALVGSCAQIGKNVHLSAGVQIGGVLEPVGLSPVVIEDDCFVGAGAVIVEGILVKKRAVIAPGVILSKSVPVYDCVNETVLEKGSAIPEGAVVVQGSRPVRQHWAREENLSVSCPIIIKYRDEGSDASLELEDVLR